MKYRVIDQEDDLVIRISGETRENEPLLAKKMLSPYLKRRGIRLIVDLDEVAAFEPVALLALFRSLQSPERRRRPGHYQRADGLGILPDRLGLLPVHRHHLPDGGAGPAPEQAGCAALW